MPYINNKEDRKKLNRIIQKNFTLLNKKGRLNYFLFKLAKDSCFDYDDFRTFEGEVQQSLREIYRRLTAPYEDSKKDENGDV